MVLDRGHISINGKQYRIDLQSYKVTDVIDFAPRAGVAGGSVIHNELGLYQPLLQTDWQHGFGFQWYRDEAGYLRTEGYVDTRHDGVAMLFTEPVDQNTAFAHEGFTTFNDLVWAWGPRLMRYDGSWTSPYAATAVNFALATGSYLFYCPDGARIRKVDTSDTHTNAGVDANASDYKWMVIWNGAIYAGKDGTSRVHYGTEDDLSDLEGTTSDPNLIYVGAGGLPTIGAIVYQSRLFISRHDGLWQLGEDLIARRVLDFSAEISSTNFRSMAIHNGFLVFPIRDKIYQWNGARLSDITPPRLSDQFPYVTYGRFDNFVSVGNFLYVTARSNEATYVESLLCWDGVGWHRLIENLNLEGSAGSGIVTGAGYDAVNNYLWYAVDDTVEEVYYIQFQDLSDFPYSNFATSGNHRVVSSRWDMGFRRVTKSSPSILIEGSNLDADQYLLVYYNIDGAGWTAWGNNDGTTNLVNSNGITELTDPTGAGSGNSTLEYKYIQIRIDLVTGTTTQTPVLEGVTLRFIMRPDVSYGYAFSIVGASHVEFDGALDERTAKVIQDDIRSDRDSKAPIEFVDLFGTTRQVYISSVQMQAREQHGDLEEGGAPNIEHSVGVNVVEVA